jgi:hypothetical protein
MWVIRVYRTERVSSGINGELCSSDRRFWECALAYGMLVGLIGLETLAVDFCVTEKFSLNIVSQ